MCECDFRYCFILFLHLVTFAHEYHWAFKVGGLAKVEYKVEYHLWRWLTSAILKMKDCKDTKSVEKIRSDDVKNVGLNPKITATDCSHHHFSNWKNSVNTIGHMQI